MAQFILVLRAVPEDVAVLHRDAPVPQSVGEARVALMALNIITFEEENLIGKYYINRMA